MVTRTLIIVHDGQQLIQHPPLHPGLKRLQLETNYRVRLMISSKPVGVTDAALPTQSRKGRGRGGRLVEDLRQLATHVRGHTVGSPALVT